MAEGEAMSIQNQIEMALRKAQASIPKQSPEEIAERNQLFNLVNNYMMYGTLPKEEKK
jgi:hypothetical protein